MHQRCARGVARHPDRVKLSGHILGRIMRRQDRVRGADGSVLEAARLAAVRLERSNGRLWGDDAVVLARPQRKAGTRERNIRRAQAARTATLRGEDVREPLGFRAELAEVVRAARTSGCACRRISLRARRAR
jgi:hypothetical protein